MLRVAIVHYHLRTGGVTRVIEHACGALRDSDVKLVVLTGQMPPAESGLDLSGVEFRFIEGLDYSGQKSVDASVLANRLQSAAAEALGGEPDLWHTHNHSLGKSAVLPVAMRKLADAGQRVLYQIHDFAEDGRPAEYKFLVDAYGNEVQLAANLYPDAGHVHYAALNDRDHEYLGACGLPAERLHLLPNAVDLPATSNGDSYGETDSQRDGGRFFLYPTRAIRRKNLGELILWAAIGQLGGQPGDRFGVTRAPVNPIQKPVYERWVQFAQGLSLPVEFEVGSKSSLPFDQLLRSADALVSTSVAEGFGLVFLEPWLMDRPLLGRKLPQITGQFENAGVDLSAMYDRLNVPLEWVGRDDLQERIVKQMSAALDAYRRPCSQKLIETALESMVIDGHVEFGRLDEQLQEKVITRVVESSEAAKQIQPANLGQNNLGQSSKADEVSAAATIRDNRRIVESKFGLEQYRGRLLEVYHKVASSKATAISSLAADRLLDRFLDPASFNLLRT
jgi:glycosyltransferase involved in cell wall biosynthesis